MGRWILAWIVGLALGVQTAVRADAPLDLLDQGRRAVRVYTTEKDGLPIDYVTCQAFDAQGHLWIGTLEGAARYNGRSWEPLPMPRPHRSNWVTALLPQADGSLWFGTAGDGVHRYHERKWTSFTADQGFAGTKVSALLALPNGDMAVGTQDEGLWVISTLGTGAFTRDASLAPRRILDLALQGDSLWTATDEGLFQRQAGSWLRFHSGNSTLPADLVHCLLGTPEALWVGTDKGLVRLEQGRWTVHREGLDDPRVEHLAQGLDGLWVATWRGLNRFRDGQFTPFGKAQGVPFPVIKHLLVEPQSNTLWIGAVGGLTRMTFGGWTSFGKDNGPFPDENISALLSVPEPKGGLTHWFGFEGGGLVKWSQGRWQAFPTAAGRHLGVIRGLKTQGSGPDTSLWVATAGEGLFELRQGVWRHFGVPQGLPDRQVNALLVTSSGVWVGTAKGLGHWNGRVWKTWTTREGLPSDEVNCLLEGPDGDLWIGTRGAGLARLHEGRWRPYAVDQGLEATQILSLSLLPDVNGTPSLWVGTAGGGAWVLDLTRPQPTWTRYHTGTLPSLPGGTMYAAGQDAQGRLYLFTNKGVARFERTGTPGKAAFLSREFTPEDGLAHLDTNWNSHHVDPLGRVWIGTPQGASVLDPTRPSRPGHAAPLRIDQAYCPDTGQPLAPGQRLSYQRQQVHFDHALLRFFKEEASQFRTQLLGLEKTPSAWSRNSATVYQRLPPGSYVHRVWALDAFGLESGPVDFPFALARAPWTSPLAWVIYAALAGLSVYGVVTLRTRMLRQQNLRLEANIAAATAEILEQKARVESLNTNLQRLNDEKNAFLGMASHDLRNPLNLIALVADGLISGDLAACPEEVLPWVEKVQRSGRDMTQLIERFLNVAAIESGGIQPVLKTVALSELLQRTFQAYDLRAQSKRIHLRLEDPGGLSAWADAQFLREILDNLVSNALKFTPGGKQVVIRAWTEAETVVVEIQDQGPGFSEKDRLTLFQPFERLSAQPTSGEQSSGLGLAIVKRLVDALGARMELRSVPGEGALFRLTFPTAEG